MIIRHDIESLCIHSGSSIVDALAQISKNQQRAVCCVDGRGHLVGVLTDGDFRRWLLATDLYELNGPVGDICNRRVVTASADLDAADVAALLVAPITMLPLVDGAGRLVAVALASDPVLDFGGVVVGPNHRAATIAEIGINHNGSVARALELVDAAATAGADIAKFQLRSTTDLYRFGGAADRREDLGAQYTMDLVSRFSLGADDLGEVFDHCTKRGIVPLCTAWDEPSIERLEEYGIAGYKVASADLTNHGLLTRLAETGRPLLLSTGMSAESEIREAITLLRQRGAPFALLHCNSTYPAPYKDINLNYLPRLAELAGGPVGYSGHERGWHVCLAAVALGAKVIEKHFTFDRSLEGADHKVSLLPEEFAAMVSAIAELEEAMGTAAERKPTQGERMNRVNLAKSLVAARPLPRGTVVAESDLLVRSPGRGLQPNRTTALVGRTIDRDVDAGDFFYPSDLVDADIVPRPYQFRRPWGLPVRYHDAAELAARSNPDFLEFHLSYRDMDEDAPSILGSHPATGLVVHSPDMFSGDFILNLASTDPACRARSEEELRRVVEVTLGLRPLFNCPVPTPIVVSPGGFTQDGPMPMADRRAAYERVAESFARVSNPEVELLAQTLPPFPWYRGGQLYCNLFVDAEDTAAFCQATSRRICLDVSHSKLAANHRRRSFAEVVELLAPHAGHLHLVDAAGVDGEGLQVGEGEVDWPVLAEQLDRLAPGISFIPEIWMGHTDGGAPFWIANERLEAWL